MDTKNENNTTSPANDLPFDATDGNPTPEITLSPFSAYVTNLGKYNEGALIGEWVEFPTTAEKMQQVFERIGIDSKEYEEYFITDYDSNIDRLTKPLGEYESLDELNYLAALINEMPEYEQAQFESILEYDSTGSAKDLINLTNNLDCFEFISGIDGDYDLGYYYVEESGAYNTEDLGSLANYIDYERFGRDIALEEGGVYTTTGYVRDTGDSRSDFYSGRDDIPDEYRLSGSPKPDSVKSKLEAAQKTVDGRAAEPVKPSANRGVDR